MSDSCRHIAATIGFFDGVHLGHRTLLDALRREAENRGMTPMVITFRQHPRNVLGNKPVKLIQTLEQRLAAIQSQGLEHVELLDFTLQLAQLTTGEFIARLRDNYGVRLLVMGYDHRFGHDRDLSFEQRAVIAQELGVEMVKAPEYLGEEAPVSSSIVRRLIASGKVDAASRCMGGTPFAISGIVEHGFANGREIGFPTANVKVPDGIILPHNGAYAVRVEIDGEWHKGMVNIGRRPTFADDNHVSVEVNIFDFNRDIYGTTVTLQFIKFLRLEIKHGTVEELRDQLERDRKKAKELLDIN